MLHKLWNTQKKNEQRNNVTLNNLKQQQKKVNGKTLHYT